MFIRSKGKKAISGMILLFIIFLTAVFCIGGAAYGSGWVSVVSGSGSSHVYRAYLLTGGYVTEEGLLREVYFGEGITPEFWKDLDIPFSPATASGCAEWIAENVEKDDSGEFSVAVAMAVIKHGLPVKAEFSSGDNIKLEDGYYLLISDETQPVMVLAGNEDIVTINEKSAAPEISKGVREGPSNAFGYQDDAGFGDIISYCITCTLPSNYNAYSSYRFVIHDSNDPGIVPDMSSIKVAVTGADGVVKKDITDYVTILPMDNGLSVECRNLKTIYGTAAGEELIKLTYYALLDTDRAKAGADSNDNYCYLEFQSSPVSDKLKETEKVKARIYTWIMELIKTDSGTGNEICGAEYLISNENGKFLNTDGTVSEKETETSIWVTDRKGRITVNCIDSGTYTITEVKAPEGYIKEEPFTVSINAEYEERGPVLTASLKGVNAGIDSVDAKTGRISIKIQEERIPLISMGIPTTGDSNNMLLYACIFAGAAAVIIFSVFIIRHVTGRTDRNM